MERIERMKKKKHHNFIKTIENTLFRSFPIENTRVKHTSPFSSSSVMMVIPEDPGKNDMRNAAADC